MFKNILRTFEAAILNYLRMFSLMAQKLDVLWTIHKKEDNCSFADFKNNPK